MGTWCDFRSFYHQFWSLLGYLGLPSRHGKIRDLNKFDAKFFNINTEQVGHSFRMEHKNGMVS